MNLMFFAYGVLIFFVCLFIVLFDVPFRHSFWMFDGWC